MNAFYWIAVAVVIVTSSARLTRLLIHDKLPPIKKVRDFYEDHTDGSGWELLTMCPYCMSFWMTAVVMVFGDLGGVFDGKPAVEWMAPAWWLINGLLGASYLAAILTVFDGDDSEES